MTVGTSKIQYASFFERTHAVQEKRYDTSGPYASEEGERRGELERVGEVRASPARPQARGAG